MVFIQQSSARMGGKTEHKELYIQTYGVEQQYSDMIVKANSYGITDSFIEHSNAYVKYCDLNNANNDKLYLQGCVIILPELYNLYLEPCYLYTILLAVLITDKTVESLLILSVTV